MLHHQTKRRAHYLEERDLANGVVYYSDMDTEEITIYAKIKYQK